MSAVNPLVSSREGGSGAGEVPGPSVCAPATLDMARAPAMSARESEVRRKRDGDGIGSSLRDSLKGGAAARRAVDVRLYWAVQQTGPRNAAPLYSCPRFPK